MIFCGNTLILVNKEILGKDVDSMKVGAGTKQRVLDLAYFLTACLVSECLRSSKEILFDLHSYGILRKFSSYKNPTTPLSKIL